MKMAIPLEFQPHVIRSAAAVGRAVRQRRTELGLTQAELAVAGLSNRQAIVQLEEGRETKALRQMFTVLLALDLELVVRPKRLPEENR
jgi:DNA-binding XRE family transcriptional regulator